MTSLQPMHALPSLEGLLFRRARNPVLLAMSTWLFSWQRTRRQSHWFGTFVGGYEVLALVEQEATSRLATVRLSPPAGGGPVVDLLFASSGIEPEIVAAAELLAIAEDLELPVAKTGHLIASKVLSSSDERLQDLIDLRALFAIADRTQLDQAREALTLIESRGFARKKNLLEELQRLIDKQ